MTLIHQEIAPLQLYQRADISDIYATSTKPDYKTFPNMIGPYAGEIHCTCQSAGGNSHGIEARDTPYKGAPSHTLPNTCLG